MSVIREPEQRTPAGAVVHWHDTPLFEHIRDARVAKLKATDADEAEDICQHFAGLEDVADYYFMRTPSTGRGCFICRACCQNNVELELLVMHEPPVMDG